MNAANPQKTYKDRFEQLPPSIQLSAISLQSRRFPMLYEKSDPLKRWIETNVTTIPAIQSATPSTNVMKLPVQTGREAPEAAAVYAVIKAIPVPSIVIPQPLYRANLGKSFGSVVALW